MVTIRLIAKLKDWYKYKNWQSKVSEAQLNCIEENARRETVYLHYSAFEEIAEYNYKEAKELYGENSKECQEAREQWHKAIQDYAKVMLNKA